MNRQQKLKDIIILVGDYEYELQSIGGSKHQNGNSSDMQSFILCFYLHPAAGFSMHIIISIVLPIM
jgi:hypothetical protein